MAVKFMILFISLITLPYSKESPIEGSTLSPEPIPIGHHHGMHIRNEDKSMHHDVEEEFDSTRKEDLDHAGNRSNYSRMLTLTTTLGYDDWWFMSTKRPRLSLKEDFPGRPGVATWKEISPATSGENRKSRKMTGPTAAGVSSGSWSFALNYHYTQNILRHILVIYFIRCFCWT